ncbi:MAG: S-methyl-5-thioribose-1-phosphate isomerase [Candidatus Omnitrophota bacterium]|nr:S-methyl-5-thioribose-1-phosphate isomerase [Candidatus Omnitrophota bacterium]
MAIETIKWENGKVKLIDQTKLPLSLEYIICSDVKTLWQAIKMLKVRGAPAIGIAAAFGVVLGIRNSKAKTFTQFEKDLSRVIKYLASSRPTAVNLFWALERMKKVALSHSSHSISRIKKLLYQESVKILSEDKNICRAMGHYGAGLIKDNDRVLTICNAGALATGDFGTALGVFYQAKTEGKKFKVYSSETRPLLQGARLTTWELLQEGIDVTLICDNMAASLMEKGLIGKVFVGADRIAANGDTANKIGTYSLAVLAHYHKIPFYVVAPKSSFDLKIKSGRDIPIEERSEDEVVEIYGKRIAPIGVKVYNPAFDVTPHGLISSIITEKGVVKPVYKTNIRKMLGA